MANDLPTTVEVHDEDELVQKIRASNDSNKVVATTLRTDERVIARVTDGIYRQPGSALRELISNAYDADATRVVIKTDAPRFDRIMIEDNGHGMTPEAIANLLFHIGGSAKRSDVGKSLGITASDSPFFSPEGRRLIGKIGIGLFSVSQLTHSFQIITKVKGDPYRTIATVALKQYSDEDLPTDSNGEAKFESGRVNIWREKAADKSSHGTTVVLTSIKPQARDTLRSREIWSVIEQNESSIIDTDEHQSIEPPKFHIGRVDSSGQLLEKSAGSFASLPWKESDTPEGAFRNLVQCVWDEVENANPNPKLEHIFDYYLRMVWQLSLAIPLPYVDGHLFDMPVSDWAEVLELSNRPKGNAKEILPKKGCAIRQAFGLTDPASYIGQFDVYIDDLKLLRPIKFKGLPSTSHALKKPLVFLGRCREEFPKVAKELSGGPLAFEAYLFWTPKVAPTEHQGSLVRIHGSSGTLFDPTFMRYQVSEQTRLRQITCEIFVNEGLDSALNIDRESFNNAHPHAVYITRWLHSALRQLATTQKRFAKEVREQNRGSVTEGTVNEIQRIANDLWTQETDDPASSPPAIELAESESKKPVGGEKYVFKRAAIVSPQQGRRNPTRKEILEKKVKAIAQVLASFDLLDLIPKRKQERLLKAIYDILEVSEE